MGTFVNNRETINNYRMEISKCLGKLTSLQRTYSENITTAKSKVDSITYSTWQDDVQASFATRTEQLKSEISKIQTSIESEHLPALISKLQDLKYKLEELSDENSNYNKMYQINKELKEYKEENGSIDGFADTIKNYNFTTETSFKSAYNRSINRRNDLEAEINAIINYISSITFGESLPSEDEINSFESSGSESGLNTTTLTLRHDAHGTYNVETTTGEENGMLVYERNTTLSGGDKTVDVDYYRIERDANDPQVGTVTYKNYYGEVTYEYFRADDGTLMVRKTEYGETGRARPVSEESGTVTMTSPDGTVTQTTINPNSELDRAMLYLQMDNALMTNHGFIPNSHQEYKNGMVTSDFFYGNDTFELGGLWGEGETTVSYEPNWDWE